MDTSYWNLFWTTGMPEAWLMSRNGETPRPPASGAGQEGGRAPSGPLAGFQPHLTDRVLGGPGWPY